MFKIARANYPAAGIPRLDVAHPDMQAQFCVSESWSGDLSTGLFTLSENAAALHGLTDNECGLVNFVRSYDPADRNHILGLFEQAATTSSVFCFSTTIMLETGQQQPLFCIGESSGLEEPFSGSIFGMFFFPRFMIDGPVVLLKQ